MAKKKIDFDKAKHARVYMPGGKVRIRELTEDEKKARAERSRHPVEKPEKPKKSGK